MDSDLTTVIHRAVLRGLALALLWLVTRSLSLAQVTYKVGRVPGYLPREKVLNELSSMFAQWSAVADIKFRQF